MPELPEVETIKNDLTTLIVDRKILDIKTDSPKQVRPSLKVVKKEIVGTSIKKIERRAKLLQIFLSNNKILIIHLKLTGRLLVRNKEEAVDKWQHVTLVLSGDKELRFADLRKFGWVRLLQDKKELEKILQEFGLEPLDDLGLKEFKEIVASTSRAIKTVLMDQKKISGIGNIYACDALLLSKIYPGKKANELKDSEIKNLFGAIERVLKAGIKYRGASDQYYLDALGHKGSYQNHFLVYGRAGKKCLKCGEKIEKIKLGGRGTLLLPQVSETMSVLKIHLSNFRNIEDKLFKFSPKITVIVGPNASGKTNILESLFLLSTGKSFRARIEEEMINYDEEIARAKGLFKDGAGKGESTIKLEAVLTRGEVGIGTAKPEKVARKKMLINGVSKRLIDFAGNFRMVLFGPVDLELVTESPSIRRRFLDTVLYQIDREYRRASLSYEKGLRQRNKLLYRIREENLPRSQLLFWDRLIIKNGNYISQKREELIGFINNQPSLNEQDFSIEYDKSAISEARFEQYQNEEIAAATTLVGPHRDDFCFKVKNPNNGKERDLARYGSRGEQRMGVLWLKLAELAFIKNETGEKPTLLLDDIFSELDKNHRKVVMKAARGQQTIITTADPHFVETLEKVEIIKLKG